MFSRILTFKSTKSYSEQIEKSKDALKTSDTVIIGAGAGLSTSAGFIYTGERFHKYFSDFEDKYDFHDMYSGAFCQYDTLEEHWAYWSRFITVNRYMDAPKPVYNKLFELVKDKDYFVITTNVDHCFQKAGFDKKRLFYTQGDYGLFQCCEPCHKDTYDNEDTIRKMIEAQGYIITEDGELTLPEGVKPHMSVTSDLLPVCPHCGRHMTMNLRSDNRFAEDEGWHSAAKRYSDFMRTRQNAKIVFLELGVGYNTPGIIKYPFWQMTAQNPDSVYVCINYDEAVCPDEIKHQSICIGDDIGKVLNDLNML